MSPYVDDFLNIEDTEAIVIFTDRAETPCNKKGTIVINILDDNKQEIEVNMNYFLLVPGLKKRLFSVLELNE